MTVEETLSLERFPVTIQTDCPNIERIYPLKQRQVSEISKCAKQFDVVKRIIIFGSSVTPRCNVDSDLDICVDADTSDGMKVYEVEKAIGDICDWNCDIIIFSNVGQSLRTTVQNEGVVIYE